MNEFEYQLPHTLWRLNVPGTASRYLHSVVRQGVQQSWQQRLCGDDTSPGGLGSVDACASANLSLVGCDAATFKRHASAVEIAPQRQHVSYDHLMSRLLRQRTAGDVARDNRSCRGVVRGAAEDRLHGLTVLRDPIEHFMRSFDKKTRHPRPSKRTFRFAATWGQRNFTALPDDVLACLHAKDLLFIIFRSCADACLFVRSFVRSFGGRPRSSSI